MSENQSINQLIGHSLFQAKLEKEREREFMRMKCERERERKVS